MSASRPRVASLGHIHEALPDPVEAFAAPKKVMAWDGGKITSNKEEATLIFLKKKQVCSNEPCCWRRRLDVVRSNRPRALCGWPLCMRGAGPGGSANP